MKTNPSLTSASVVDRLPVQKLDALRRYAELKRRIEEALLSGQRAVEFVKVRSYWETGWYINQHVRLRGGRAAYGKQIMTKLSKDLVIHESILRRCAEFSEKFPQLEIRATWRELVVSPLKIKGNDFKYGLTWSHFRALLTVEDERTRLELAREAARKKWTVPQLEAQIKKINADLRADQISRRLLPLAKRSPLLVPKWGRLNTY